MRNTLQKDIVKKVVLAMDNHPTAEAVYEVVNRDYPAISRATVFRILKQMWETGELEKVPLPDAADRFDLRLDKHYHVRCRICGEITDVKMKYQQGIADKVEDARGYSLENHLILFEGICPDCK